MAIGFRAAARVTGAIMITGRQRGPRYALSSVGRVLPAARQDPPHAAAGADRNAPTTVVPPRDLRATLPRAAIATASLFFRTPGRWPGPHWVLSSVGSVVPAVRQDPPRAAAVADRNAPTTAAPPRDLRRTPPWAAIAPASLFLRCLARAAGTSQDRLR
ncbi:hypothetical protein JR065_02475 [Xanthomonas sp. AmX2]|uniref:hypothetical protein n=1 Tax=Xanthomonas sp. TaxID=29446 RepID=UPI00197D4BB6|nr:hypothetical protein [Xanthomonas sp.]MBN6149194.1 hypothetical protein [Xanthomonas sp.]